MNNQPKGTATREELQEIHRVLCETFMDYLTNTPPGRIRASMLDVIRSFLKDNHISKNLSQAKDVTESLKDLSELSVPFLPDYNGGDTLN